MRSLQTDEEVGRELRKRGIEEEKIKMAFELKKQIKTLDRMIFPENPRPFCFILKESHPGQCATYGPDGADDEDRFYGICLENLLKNLTEGKEASRLMVPRKGKTKRQSNLPRYTWKELFVATAAHEVRHRLQFNCSIRRFSLEAANSVDDRFLKDVIKLVGLEFNHKRQILNERGVAEEYIDHVLDSLEFDAEVIEKIVAYKVHEKAPLDEIVSVIQMQAPKRPK